MSSRNAAKGEYTEEQIRRLRSLETSGRINKVFIELFDWWTDVVFLATLYIYAEAGPSVPLFEFLASTTGSSSCDATLIENRDNELYTKLFIASAVVLFVNFCWRLGVGLAWVRRYKEIQGWEWATFLFGVAVTIVEPNNGLLIIDGVMDEKRVQDDEKRFNKREVLLKLSLICVENLPQFVIQLIFGLNSPGDLAISWYVATFTTVLHLLSQLVEFGAAARRFYYSYGEDAVPLIAGIRNSFQGDNDDDEEDEKAEA